MTTRIRLLVLAAALSPALASAQSPSAATAQQDSTRRVTPPRVVQTSKGTVSRRPARRPATMTRAGEPRATPRDYVGADSGICDDLCQRERRLDSLYGKDRERRPGRPGSL